MPAVWLTSEAMVFTMISYSSCVTGKDLCSAGRKVL